MKRIALNRYNVMTIFTEKSSKFPTEISCEKKTQNKSSRLGQTRRARQRKVSLLSLNRLKVKTTSPLALVERSLPGHGYNKRSELAGVECDGELLLGRCEA